MRVPHASYVLVADGAKMLFFRNEGDAERLNLQVVDAEQQRDAPDRDIKSGPAGQKPGGAALGGGNSAGEADFHRQNEDRFAADAAEMINRAALAHRFESLVIVAPPRTLGELRRHFHKEAAARITAEIPKDLANHPVDRIEAALIDYEGK